MRAFIQRHPAASYFLLAIVLSWGGIVAVIWPGSLPASAAEAERLFVRVYFARRRGSRSVGGRRHRGSHGWRHRTASIPRATLRWRVAAGWYAAALLTAPIAIALALLALSVVSPEFAPAILSDQTSQRAAGPIHAAGTLALLVTGLSVGIGAGVFEELGWTGVAVPKMLTRHGLLVTGLGVGLVWGAWDLLAIYWGSGDAIGSVPAPVYLLVALFSFLLPYRIRRCGRTSTRAACSSES